MVSVQHSRVKVPDATLPVVALQPAHRWCLRLQEFGKDA